MQATLDDLSMAAWVTGTPRRLLSGTSLPFVALFFAAEAAFLAFSPALFVSGYLLY
jgi:hypothetical protein